MQEQMSFRQFYDSLTPLENLDQIKGIGGKFALLHTNPYHQKQGEIKGEPPQRNYKYSGIPGNFFIYEVATEETQKHPFDIRMVDVPVVKYESLGTAHVTLNGRMIYQKTLLEALEHDFVEQNALFLGLYGLLSLQNQRDGTKAGDLPLDTVVQKLSLSSKEELAPLNNALNRYFQWVETHRQEPEYAAYPVRSALFLTVDEKTDKVVGVLGTTEASYRFTAQEGLTLGGNWLPFDRRDRLVPLDHPYYAALKARAVMSEKS